MIPQLNALYDEAKELYQRKSWKEAWPLLEQIGNDAEASARYGRSLCHYRIYTLGFGLGQPRDAQRLCDDALARFPDWAMGWYYAGRFWEELGDPLAAFRCYKTAIRKPEGTQGYAEYHAFALLLQRRRYRVAAKLMPLVEPHRERFTGTPMKFAEIHVVNWQWQQALIELDRHESSHPPDSWTNILRLAAEGERVNGPYVARQRVARHIAIGGESYVGSTVLGTILGSVDGAAHVGESHWLTERQKPDGGVGPIDFDGEIRRGVHWCHKCGPRCEVLSRAFRDELARDPTDWYQQISRRLETDCLVSSDKSFYNYWRRDPRFEFDLIVLYKSPGSHFQSYLKAAEKKRALNIEVSEFAVDRDRLLGNWRYHYQNLLGVLRPRGKRIFVNWEGFAARPHEHFHRILEILGLPGSSRVFGNIKFGHFIGGNDVEQIVRTGKFLARPSSPPALSEDDDRSVRAHRPSQEIFRLIENSYRRQFADLV
jgi:tetratricopeptide (TPR) repeat protein